jgi:ribosomal protein L11 methyltransferase
MPWLQLKIITPRRYVSSLEDSLLACGAASVTLQDNADQPILEPGLGETPLWDSVKITGLFDAEIDTAKTIALAERRFGNPLPEHNWEQLEDKDWEREWMSSYHAIRCGERLWICPSWQQPPEPDKVNLMLDPGLAFGTGTHPTTFLLRLRHSRHSDTVTRCQTSHWRGYRSASAARDHRKRQTQPIARRCHAGISTARLP